MNTRIVSDTHDLWEAWVDLGTGGSFILYVVGDISMGNSRAAPLLLKKSVQGASASHLVLEVLPGRNRQWSRQTEVGYAEPIADINKYRQISICAGEDVIACISDIEVVY